jgi:ABC-type sugar transport system ATPase subunit
MDGRIVQVATPKEIFGRPAHASVAGFIGTPPMNLLPATWRGSEVVLDGAGRVRVGPATSGERAVWLGVRAADLRVAPEGLAAQVELVEELGDSHIVIASVGDQRVKLRTDASSALREGERVHLGFAPAAAHLFDRAGGERLN